ncbi:hypothetical protein GCM10010193_09760 [Kitasatospora atroaurantiaca]|uniref:Nucleoside-diphosphate-sugar epimerase n=1 Tax=Kitasatospora atroaurantiaca TaxID=285545 RepID=A0A561ES43_9ACTN|nr:NAD-dependent epimerase/dehydratase family protein [Kitasatospora atroaurantiaca]TWE18427.1 nucleoside-diphosphate-sugar epimerase [Kitasatospora atroaurantiaca]
MTALRILVTGGTGFVGSQVLRLLDGVPVRLLTHRRASEGSDRAEVVQGDLGDGASLRGLCTGVDTVVHLASQIGGDPELCHEVNARGTSALLAEAARAGVRRFIHLSTTAVYRDGVHRNADERQLALEPQSVTSRSRLLAEQQVLAAGGIVIRPSLVYGTGDVWVVPTLVELMTRVPHWIDGGRARLSVIAVDDLARPIAALARAPWEPASGGQVYHACDPVPVLMRDLVTVVAEQVGAALPSGEVSLAQAGEMLAASDGTSWGRRLSLLAVDHWYESSRLWQRTGCTPGPGFAARFADHAPWYRSALSPMGGPVSSRG